MLAHVRPVAQYGLYLGGYLALHWASDVYVLADFRVTPWNPETGLSFLMASLWGPLAWPALFIANFAGGYVTGHSNEIQSMLLRSALYATAYSASGTIFRTWASADQPGSLSQIIKLLVVSALAALLFGSLLVSGINWLTRMPSPRLISAIITSATGDLIGILSIVPLYIACLSAPAVHVFRKRHLVHLTTGLLVIGTTSFVVFGLDSTGQFKFFYLVLLPVVAFSLLHGFVGAALSIFASDLIMMAIIHGRHVAPGTATELQILMITLSATGLLLGSVVSERRRLSSELIESHQLLSDAQARLLHASRVMLINEMASAIAHEINQPLSAIRNYCRTIQRLLPGQQIDRERLGSLVGAAVEQVDTASSLINDTRRFVRRETPETAQASLADTVALCFRLLQQEIVKGGVQVKADVSSGLLAAMQPVKLQQVLLNLLRNSIEAMGEQGGGKIEVSAHRTEEGRIFVTIRDTGTGIPQTMQTELFRPFVTTKKHGLGLGLSLSRSIVNEHGGNCGARRRCQGRPAFASRYARS